LNRYLKRLGFKVLFVQNFTDVDDKIIKRAKKEMINTSEVSSRYIKSYFNDFSKLGVIGADIYPKATDHINDMISIIEKLLENDFAYITINGIYFRVNRFSSYGKLSGKSIAQLESGTRVEIDPLKEDPLDFALWKFSHEDPCWKSPWGKGRPGWHIECSAMALKYLGNEIEIHGGGQDLIFPHHENEIAQSESYSSRIFSKLWMHVGLVTLHEEKMSKSIGNIMLVKEALTKCGPNALRLFLLTAHYAKPLNYSERLLSEASQKWRQIENCIFELRSARKTGDITTDIRATLDKTYSDFRAAMDDDMNTSLALSSVLTLASLANRLSSADNLTKATSLEILRVMEEMLEVLGLRVEAISEDDKVEIERLIEKRNILRKQKRFHESDIIRNQLYDTYGIELMDHESYTIWKKIDSPHIHK
jgi:cysteinyl-tRNA synthetase